MTMKAYLGRSVVFVLIGLLLYAAVYYASDVLVYEYARRNRFYTVKTADAPAYDYVILGASHALPFDFEDMNARLEDMAGARIINLSTPGGGVVPNRLLLEYFLARHETKNVVYFVDSFVFYSKEWNEERLNDVKLFQRAPFDLVLARRLLSDALAGEISAGAALDYISGFSKINNPNRFDPDVSDDELKRFDATHRPSSNDKKRIDYLYPAQMDAELFERYLSMFMDLITDLKAQRIGLIVVKPPLPKLFHDMIPNESSFDRLLAEKLSKEQIPFYDLALENNDDAFFFDSDHLNRLGVLSFFDNHLSQLLKVPR